MTCVCPVRLVLCISSVKTLARAYYLLYKVLELATVRLGWCDSFSTSYNGAASSFHCLFNVLSYLSIFILVHSVTFTSQ